jgi:HAD superfamily hydrolase (TIGR01490 family)
MRLTLFDLDGTLLPRDSDHGFGEYLVSLGWVDADAFRRRNDQFFADYQAGQLDVNTYVDFATAGWRGRSDAELAALTAGFLRDVIRPMLLPQALDLVKRHQQAGDEVVLVTATIDFITRPICQLFGIDHLIATELERDKAGRVRGTIRGVPSFREGKVTRVTQWLAERGLTWADCESTTFYSDSTNDLPLLEHCSRPVATNPGPALERIAIERGWPVLKLFT